MILPMPRSPSAKPWLWLLAGGLLALAGCGETQGVPPSPAPRPPAEPKVRLLAAIFENGKEQWFFKLLGARADVDRHADEFRRFVETVRFTGKAEPPVEWQAPPSWDKEVTPGKELRYA